MKHAELILGAMVTPEALARLIVHIIQIKGPLPVGEIGKQLQEVTSNESLSVVLKTQYKGLKKVIEGFGKIFRLGADHPFNPLVHLSDGFIAKRDECLYDEGALADLYVFDSSIALAAQDKAGRAPPSPRRAGDSSNPDQQQFVPLVKGGKSHSFKDGSSQSSYDRSDVKRSGSLSSASGIALNAPKGGAKGKGKGGAKAAAAPQVPRGGKTQTQQQQQQQQYYMQQQQQQYYQQQYQQYQQQMMYQQQQYQLYLQQQQQQGGQEGSEGSSEDGPSSSYPAYPMSPGAYPMPPPNYPGGYPMAMAPQMSGSPEAGAGFYPPNMALPPGAPHMMPMSMSMSGSPGGSPMMPQPGAAGGMYVYYAQPSAADGQPDGKHPHPPGSEDGY
jgi:hypothetical protein